MSGGDKGEKSCFRSSRKSKHGHTVAAGVVCVTDRCIRLAGSTQAGRQEGLINAVNPP